VFIGDACLIVEASKACGRCGESKLLSAFYGNANGRLGLHSSCKACMNASKAVSKQRFRSAGLSRIPAAKKCAMCGLTHQANAFSAHATSGDGLRTYCKDCDRVVRRANKYGLSRERVAEMLQQSCCEACKKPLEASSHKCIDHRHADGAVRGVLCEPCNTTLGKCLENRAVLLGLVAYLDRTESVDYRFQPYLEQILDREDISSLGHSPQASQNDNV
jgi:hypothetical protein